MYEAAATKEKVFFKHPTIPKSVMSFINKEVNQTKKGKISTLDSTYFCQEQSDSSSFDVIQQLPLNPYLIDFILVAEEFIDVLFCDTITQMINHVPNSSLTSISLLWH